MTAAPSPDAQPSFEEAFAALQQAVADLEGEDIALDDLVQRYESGVRMLRACQQHLGAAELRIRKLREDGSLAPLDPPEEESA